MNSGARLRKVVDTDSDIVRLSACQTMAAFRTGDLSRVEVMEACLRRIESVNPEVNAIVSLRDGDELLKEAAAADTEATSRAAALPSLHGLPTAFKDLSDAVGFPTTQGFTGYRNHLPNADSWHIQRIRAAGAIPIGKTNVPEFGIGSHTHNRLWGTTRNPYDLGRSAGGSSGGAAAALASNMVAIADGSDHMGSLRNPASFNGVWSLRPTPGRVPAPGHLAELATAGPMARTVEDLRLLYCTMAGFDARDPQSIGLDPLEPGAANLSQRVAWLRVDQLADVPVEPGVLEGCDRATKHLEDLGYQVDCIDPSWVWDEMWEHFTTLRSWTIHRRLGNAWRTPGLRGGFPSEAVWECDRGEQLSLARLDDAFRYRDHFLTKIQQFWSSYKFVMMPAVQVMPFPVDWRWPKTINNLQMDTYHRWMSVMVPWTMSGVPVLTAPISTDEKGMPIGVQVAAAHRDEGSLLDLASRLERMTQQAGCVGRGVKAIR